MAGRKPSGAAFRAIPRSAISCSGPARSELSKAYACDTETSIRIGHIQQDASIPAMVKIDELLGKHFAVLGTTGTGKSCSVALILRRILEKNPQAHILLLDVHREYAQSFKEWSEVITPDNMNLPFWLLNFEEIVEILIGNAAQPRDRCRNPARAHPDRQAALHEQSAQGQERNALRHARSDRNSPISASIRRCPIAPPISSALLEEYIGKLELRGELAPYKRLKARIETISRDPRYAFMFGSLTVQDTMAQVLVAHLPHSGQRQADRHPRTRRPAFRDHQCRGLGAGPARLRFRRVERRPHPDHLRVRRGASLRADRQARLGFEPTKRAISRIAKEGRKYGVSLCIVTQRPAELDPTILSQCNTIFSFRLTNERDQDILRAGISDAARKPSRIHVDHGHRRCHHLRRRRGAADPHQVRHAAARTPAQEQHRFLHRELGARGADENFLQDVVKRWRQQSFGSISVEPDLPQQPQTQPQPGARPAAGAGTLQRQPAAAAPRMPVTPAPMPDLQGLSRLRRTLPPLPQGDVPSAAAQATPVEAGTGGAQPSLSSLLKQFRA